MSKTYYRCIGPILEEIRQMHFREALEEAQRNFLRAKRRSETFRRYGKGQSKISSKKWKK